ncbi:arylformamidase [Caldalkalibacillus uzonensis]|uniref:Arylformamidase n=1 Tax=Caldalkalibacillus uzonensis TaxID=353224 RepID=A0ABU0CU80_9BACI|nr:cyclase family protein [Caldalkalibacillus uzonensis]MDQ0339663.1 arylformamidase [Caldalkalibacillus uzonensis]
MKIYDISMPIHQDMPVYKNKVEKKPHFEVMSDFKTGKVHETRIHLDVHTGTHVDAHLHMFEDGETIEAIRLEELVGPCKVLDFTHVEDGISKADLEQKQINPSDFILLKTKNSFDTEFNFEFIYLKEDGARYLADIGVKGVGIDALGIERNQPGHPTHKTLMNKNIIILEGIKLDQVDERVYFMVAAPLKLLNVDAAPARVMLFDQLPAL